MELRISKKILSLLLVMTVMCGLLFTAAAVADEEESSSASASIVINSAEDLEDMTSGDYVLGANISIDAATWTPISKFSGTFDGNGYTITWTGTSESSMKSIDSYFAIFGSNSGTIKNLTVGGALYVTGSDVDYVSTVVGYNVGTITGVTNEATLYANNTIYNVGGIAGYNAGIISYSANEANITGYSQVGGIVGENAGIIEICSNIGDVLGTRVGKGGTGGIAGRNGDNNTATTTGIIRNCYNQGDITSQGSSGQGRWVGGIAGFQNSLSSVFNSYNTGIQSAHGDYSQTIGSNENTSGMTYCYGLEDIYTNDGTTPLNMSYMQSQSFVDTLNSNAGATFWVYDSGAYPTLVAYSSGANYTFTMTSSPTTTSYTAGATFDPTGMVITATSTGGTSTVTSSNYVINPNRTLIASDTCVIVLGTYNGASFSFIVPITVYSEGDIYLDGTAEVDGDGTADNPYSNLASALDNATTTGDIIYVCGTVTIPSGSYYDDVTFKRASGFSGALFSVTSGTVRMAGSTMVIDGDGSGTLFEVTGGELYLRGGVTLQNCDTAVAVNGGTVEVNYADITATGYSVYLSFGDFILDNFGFQNVSITGTVYLSSGTYITAGNAIPCALTVESAVTTSGTVIAAGDGSASNTSGYFLTSADLGKLSVSGYFLTLDSSSNQIKIM